MTAVMKWWTRLAAAVSGAVLTLVVPAYAWAASSGVVEAARYRRRGGFGFIGLFGGLCCLFVIGAVILIVLLITRGRRKKGQP